MKNMTIKLSWHIIIFFTLKLSIYRLIIFSPPQYINHLKRYYLFIYLLFWKYYLDSISCPIIFIWLGKINPKWCIGKHLLNTFQDFAVLVFRWYLQWMLVDRHSWWYQHPTCWVFIQKVIVNNEGYLKLWGITA